MSDNTRRKQNQAVGSGFALLLGFCLVALITGHLTHLSGVQSERRHQYADGYAKGAKDDAKRACAGVDQSLAFDCIYERVEASQDQATARLDLEVQQGMQFWAIVMAYAAIGSLALTAAALYYIRGTLLETAKMAKDSRKMAKASIGATEAMYESNKIAQGIGQAQVKAYVRCDEVTCKHTGQNSVGDVYSLVIKTKNLGQSPALDVQVIVGIELIEFNGGHLGQPLQLNVPHEASMAPQGEATAMVAFGFSKGSADVVRSSQGYLRITVAYVYKDVFGEQVQLVTCHHTEGAMLDSGMTAAHITIVKPEQ